MQPSPPSGAICAVHAGVFASGTCPRCGNFVCERCLAPGQGLHCAKCREKVDVTREPPPWERRAELGFIPALVEQWKTTMLSPERFWRSVPAEGSMTEPLLYAWLLFAAQAPLSLVVQAWNFGNVRLQLAQMSSQLKTPMPAWLDSVSPWTFALGITLGPLVLYPLSYFLGAGLNHLGCLLTGAAPKGFTATARVMGYAQAPILFMWIPYVGGMLSFYVLVQQILGIARVHETTGVRAAFGILLIPLLLSCCAVVGIIIAAASFASRL